MSNDSGQFRFTSIIVAEGVRRRLYRSVDEMPADVRKAMLEATNGERSATILIADEAGEKFLQEVVQAQERAQAPVIEPAPPGFWRTTGWRWTVELGICSGAAFLLWFLATLR